jgi:hypothetical protein
LTRDWQPVLRYARVSSPNAKASNLFISGIPYALDTYPQFTNPVYPVFSRNDRGLQRPHGDIEAIIDFILCQNRNLRGYLRDRLDSLRQIGIVPMNESDKEMNLAVFDVERLFLNDHQMKVLRGSYQLQKLSQSRMLYDPLVYPWIFWTGAGGCGIMESERLQVSTSLIGKVLIVLILQPRDHFIHELATLREQFIYAVYGRLINLDIKYLAQAQRRCFAREDEIRDENSDGVPKESGLRTFIPLLMVHGDEYWHYVATKCLAISTHLGPPTLFLMFTKNAHWRDYQAFKRDNDIFVDSALGLIIFKTTLSALMKVVQEKKIFGKVLAFIWRIESRKRGLPRVHMMFWSDFRTQDVHTVEAVVNFRCPKDSPFPDDECMVTDFR